MMRSSRALAAGLALALAACANGPGGGNIGESLSQFTVVDLNAADADAKAHGDRVASTCYEALVPVVQNQAARAVGTPVGVVSAFQAARDVANNAAALPNTLQGLNVPCAPLVLDTKATILKLGALVTGGVATAGILSAGALPLVPIP